MPSGINQKMNILDLNYSIRHEIEQHIREKWKKLLAVVTEGDSQFNLRDYEIGEIEQEQLRKGGCPVTKLLDRWGDRGMTVNQLAKYLDCLRLERSLTLIRDPEELYITEDVQTNVAVSQGERLQLTCKADGFPYPKYTWFKLKTELHRGYADGILTVDTVRMEDAGYYICRVHNSLKKYVFSSWCLVTVNKVTTPAQRPHRPQTTHKLCIVEQPSPCSVTVPMGQQIHLKCRAVANTAPMYQWIKGDTWLQGATSSELKINKAALMDSGQYKCVVRSGSEELISDMVAITVHSSQINISKYPQIVLQPSPMTVCPGGIAHFHMEAWGPEPLRYTWYHNGHVIPDADTGDLQLSVTVESAGMYQCCVSTDQPNCHCLSREARLEVSREYVQYSATDKVALLIGISRYRGNSARLPAVINDIYFTRLKLEELRFKVISLVNLDLTEMHKAVDWFCQMLAKGVYGVFYVAGHGFQYQGQHYLVPWDAPEGLKLKDCLCIQEVQMKAQLKKPAVLLMFLDICRKESNTIDQTELATRYLPAVTGNCCTFFSASYGEASFEPEVMHPFQDTVIPHSLSEGNICTSIFSKYLLLVFGAEKPIPDVFRLLMDEMRTSREYYSQYQTPEMYINLKEHGRSLIDPINYNDDLLAFNQRTELWAEMHQLPQPVVIGLNFQDEDLKVGIQFLYFFTNVLCMTINPPVDKLGIVEQLKAEIMDQSIPVVIKTVERCRQSKNIMFVFQDLQKLDRQLKPRIQLWFSQWRNCINVPELNLGWPLVSQLQQKQHLVRPGGSREPTQQDETSQGIKPGQ